MISLMLQRLGLCLFVLFWFSCGQSQITKKQTFSRADSLRGALRPERTCFDVHFYDLQLQIFLSEQTISGSNRIVFQVKETTKRIQLDLFSQFTVDSIIWNQQGLTYQREDNVIWVDFPINLSIGTDQELIVFYHGRPNVARNPPWDGGFVWKKDKNGKPWVGVACEGHGASSWWPLKDHLSDEPDSMRMRFTIPAELECVSNGTLQSVILSDDQKWATYDWFVSYPINSYNVTLNIGDYEHFSEVYESDSIAYELDFYVLSYNLEKAKQHFRQVRTMLRCF
ncbi:MAG: M1 family peptidase, partial [Bacteroidia bacterium]|nr:M1 family peptidase [Bacteroidia bacterium]